MGRRPCEEPFPPVAAQAVLKTPLHGVVKDDRRVWWPKRKGKYSVHSSYRLCMEEFLELDHLMVNGNWKALWNLCVSPKVKKKKLWIAVHDCLPTRAKLNSRGVQCDAIYPWCASNLENNWHILISCSKAEAV